MTASSIQVEPHGPIGTTAYPSIVSAYRQILYRVYSSVIATADQPMYCDIYFGGVYYKTISSYTIVNNGSTKSTFTFDIQDAAQEYLTTYIPTIPISVAQQSDPVATNSIVSCLCKFRGSSFVGGLLVPEATAPIQGTATTAPVSGTGLASTTITIYNASLPETWATIYDNGWDGATVFTSFEDYLKINTVVITGPVSLHVYPLSSQPSNSFTNPFLGLCNSQWVGYNGGIPFTLVLYDVSGILSRVSRNCTIKLIYGANGSMITTVNMSSSLVVAAGHTYYLPCGIADIKLLISGSDYTTFISQSDAYYRVALFDDDTSEYCFISPLYKLAKSDNAETVSVWFQNRFGHFENFTFLRNSIDYSTRSSTQFDPYTQIFNSGVVTSGLSTGYPNALTLGLKRYNIRSNDELSLTATVQEQLMPWLTELFASPYTLQQVTTGSGGFRALETMDGTFKTKKTMTEAGVQYTITVKMRPAIDPISLRN